MPDGSKWDVPAEVIAKNRADYYEAKDPGCYNDEYKRAMEDDIELADWAANNMNWEDVQSSAVKHCDGRFEMDFQDGWVNGEKEVIVQANAKVSEPLRVTALLGNL